LSNPYTGVAAIFSSRLLNNNSPIVYEDGLQSRDFIHVSDIVQANLLAMTAATAVNDYFNVGTGRTTTVLDVARVMGRALGKDIEPTIVNKFREGDIRHCVSDISKAQRVLAISRAFNLKLACRNWPSGSVTSKLLIWWKKRGKNLRSASWSSRL